MCSVRLQSLNASALSSAPMKDLLPPASAGALAVVPLPGQRIREKRCAGCVITIDARSATLRACSRCKHDIARSRIGPVRMGTWSPDDNIGEAVSIDVAGAGDRPAVKVMFRHAVEPETISAIEGRKIDAGGKARGLSKHHIARSRRGPVQIGVPGSNDQVGETVIIDIPRSRDRG